MNIYVSIFIWHIQEEENWRIYKSEIMQVEIV